ncbi:hypothetical protein EYF80_021704 [Liparis tanakae]|uniref:Uncharacterized protein n=1 Tax=Liparis tanakae TaxID=230148 RepID=A0A4Z2HQE5_9TELE|nr:hypothetical protein EYF80_021704 [Liparis tanakae]
MGLQQALFEQPAKFPLYTWLLLLQLLSPGSGRCIQVSHVTKQENPHSLCTAQPSENSIEK